LNHRNLTWLSTQDAHKEIFESKKWLEDEFGFPIRHFSYPYGAWDERIEEAVQEAGYATAVTTAFGVNDGQTNKYRFRRISAYGSLRELFFAFFKLRR
jgi:peptidoglycan/xylan/chitin deacetylase (PgdA/CDA1 family)